MTSLIQKFILWANVWKRNVFAAMALALVVMSIGAYTHSKVYAVEIREGEQAQTYYTMEDDPDEILEEFGYETRAEDDVACSGFYSKQAQISITRAFPVTLRYDGVESVVMTTGGTSGELLKKAGVALETGDRTNTPLHRDVQEGDVITVTRWRQHTWQEEHQLPYETVAIPTSLLPAGQERVLRQGAPGLQVDTYQQLVVDGIEEDRRLASKQIVQEPVSQQILVGEPAHPISKLDFGYQLDQNGEPVGYSTVFRAQRAAGYSARPGARTASGREAIVGHVAVDPNLIPYGSKLYIKSADGNFVYGYAVAADTGTAIRDGVIAVDLFYGTYLESALNEIRYVDIFILP